MFLSGLLASLVGVSGVVALNTGVAKLPGTWVFRSSLCVLM